LITPGIDPEIAMKGLRNMKQLRFLHVFDKNFAENTYYWRICEDEDCFDKYISPVFFPTAPINEPTPENFNEVRLYFPNALRWLSWKGYPFRSLPKSFQPNNLVALEISNSIIAQLWEYEDRKVEY